MRTGIANFRQFAVRFSHIAILSIAIAGWPGAAAWRATGPFGGDADLVRTVPKAKNLVIAGTRNGLLFTSLNGGASWNNIAFPGQFSGALHALEIDPRDAGTWYAGMESANEWSCGVYKTTDGGRTWKLLPQTKGMAVWSLAVWPRNPDVIAAGTGDGIFLTRDAGTEWKRISPAGDTELRPVVSLAFHPNDSNVLFAGTTHLPWRTKDGGVTWDSIHEGMMDDSDVFSIQVDSTNPERVFASACSGVYGSANGAVTWSHLDTPKGAFRTHFVAIDPAHEGVVFAGTTGGLLRSPDSGRNWRKVSVESVKSIAFDPFIPNRVFFASPTAGLLLSTDGGVTLHEANNGFTNRNFTSVTGSGTEIYASSVYEPGSGGIYRTDNLGLRWVHVGEPAADELLLMAAAPDNPNVIFAAGYRGLLESIDGGHTWKHRPGPPGSARVTALLPVSSSVLFVGTDSGLFRNSGKEGWIQCAEGSIEALRSSGKTVSANTPGAPLVSTDAGASWRKCGIATPSANLYSIDFDSANDSLALQATSAGVFRSTDGCVSWRPVRDGLRPETATVVLFHPDHPGEAFASQGGRIFCSTDGGQRWLPLDDEGLSNSGPSSLFVLPAAPGRLFALFPRRGVFFTSIGSVSLVNSFSSVSSVKEKPLQ